MGPPRRTEIKKIEDLSARQVTFSKRRNGLFRKAKRWSVSYDAEVAVIVFSNTGKLYQFSSTSMEHTLLRYNNKGVSSPDEKRQHEAAAKPETLNATVLLQEQIASLKSDCSRMRGRELDGLSLKELDELEKELNQGILSITKRKDEVLLEDFYSSKSKEEQIMEILSANNYRKPSSVLELFSDSLLPLDRSRLFYASSSNDIASCSESAGSGKHKDLSLQLSLSL
ncbi:PREDICTED: agamous-like MADS-box protein AGL18 [Fragaria vesca subsp. vesca]|uniref:agamous-like MADS-box protein AGL18 n=1 Tax=Fragaria vesca subsp. vesca TaxID=101020 RepID=UPI0002C338E1|nr:PREDICTED: agamous-like MADS-box protein AGL18 [Fragaria vesca subsp. vesca]